MKTALIALVLTLASVASAQKAPHWVNITPGVQPNTTHTQTLLLDDANLIVEGGFKGYNIRIVQPTDPFTLDTGFVGITRLLVVEVNCTNGEGRGMRVGYEGAEGTSQDGDHIWRVIGHEPATIIYSAVKDRACR